MPEKLVIVVTFIAEPNREGGPDQWQRLRMFLKRMLRDYGFRCLRIEPGQEPVNVNDVKEHE